MKLHSTDASRVVETLLTVAAAGIATAVSLNGMWRVFGDVLHLDGPGRVATAGFLELALVVSALRARRSLREDGSVGVDGAAVWVIAVVSAVVSAADADGLAKAVRLAAPVLAAWLWERGLAADRRAVRDRRPVVIAWRWTRERLAVRLGLADPIERATTDVDRARRLAALTRARLRLAVLETVRLPWPLALVTARPVRAAVAAWRLQRHALAAVEHLHLGTDPGVPVTIRATVAAVVGLRAATTPAALTAASPWTQGEPAPVSVPEVVPAPALVTEPAPVSEPVGSVVNGYALTLPYQLGDPGGPVSRSGLGGDAEIVAEIVASGVVPSLRAIRAAYRVGQDRARRLQAEASCRAGGGRR